MMFLNLLWPATAGSFARMCWKNDRASYRGLPDDATVVAMVPSRGQAVIAEPEAAAVPGMRKPGEPPRFTGLFRRRDPRPGR
jgi:hypothetical protein